MYEFTCLDSCVSYGHLWPFLSCVDLFVSKIMEITAFDLSAYIHNKERVSQYIICHLNAYVTPKWHFAFAILPQSLSCECFICLISTYVVKKYISVQFLSVSWSSDWLIHFESKFKMF